jgi:hypothetical protein
VIGAIGEVLGRNKQTPSVVSLGPGTFDLGNWSGVRESNPRH